ncbi:MAG: hypothetical protein ACK4N4_03135 [Burkholderiales bacterium]
MNKLRVIFVVSLAAASFAVVGWAAEKGVASWPGTADQIRKGKIDVGKTYGMEFGQRFHKIHADTIGVGCNTCHSDNVSTSAQRFSQSAAVDMSKNAPGAVDRRVCLSCHSGGGIARDAYGPEPPAYGPKAR